MNHLMSYEEMLYIMMFTAFIIGCGGYLMVRFSEKTDD